LLEIKYITLLSSRLRNFKRKGNVLNFSCPLCGDSQNKKNKSRGYIYLKKDKWMYHCHNCGVSILASQLLKTIDQGLYSDYVLENLQSNKTESNKSFVDKLKPKKYEQSIILKDLKKVSQLPSNHIVKKFVTKRKIPTTFHHKLYACPNFMEFTNKIITNKFSKDALNHDEARLLIPFINSNQEIHAFQGRAVHINSDIRYITIVIDETIPKVYGLDTVNFNIPVRVFEGPIDSMFISNSISTAGGDLGSIKGFDRESLIIVYDNEPRSIETIKKLDKTINQGYKVCIWPNNIQQKDVNDMILAGYSATEIEGIIDKNTYSNLTAKLMLSKWRKI